MIDSLIDFLIGITLSFDDAEFVWVMLATLLVCFGSVIALFGFIRHGRIMQDTPTSKIRSASQGFVQLEGRAKSLDDKPLRVPGSGRECVWFDYLIEKKGNDWEEVERDTSIYSFYVDDGTGLCAVDPELGRVITRKKKVWVVGDWRYTERLIAENDRVYCLGQFETDQGGSKAEVLKVGVRVLLNQWKHNRRNYCSALTKMEMVILIWMSGIKLVRLPFAKSSRRQLTTMCRPSITILWHRLIKVIRMSFPVFRKTKSPAVISFMHLVCLACLLSRAPMPCL